MKKINAVGGTARARKVKTAVTAIVFMFALFYLFPFALVLLNSFKTTGEIATNVLSLPTSPSWVNYANVIHDMAYPRTLLNTALLTGMSAAGIVLFSSLAGYKLSRTRTKYSFALFIFCIIPMMIPFQSYMISFVKVVQTLGLRNSLIGCAVVYWALGAPLSVFLYHGFVKTIPQELDECSTIDGCGAFRTYASIIFPLLKPVTATVVVFNAMWVWNDYLLPLLTIGDAKNITTLVLAANKFFGMYKTQWQNVMAGVVLTIIPAIVIYLIFQKQIIKGMVSGAIKG